MQFEGIEFPTKNAYKGLISRGTSVRISLGCYPTAESIINHNLSIHSSTHTYFNSLVKHVHRPSYKSWPKHAS